MVRLRDLGARFGDFLCAGCANLPYEGGHNLFQTSVFALGGSLFSYKSTSEGEDSATKDYKTQNSPDLTPVNIEV